MAGSMHLQKERCAVILTAIPAEYSAVRAHLVDPEETRHPQGTVYEQGSFIDAGGLSWRIGIVEIGAGNPGAALETERAVRYFDPGVVLFVGVAGGLKDVVLCDVVAATKVYGYEAGKAQEDFQPRPDVGESSYSMVQRARAEAKKDRWLMRLGESFSNPPHAYVAPIAAGEKVLASRRSDVHRFVRTAYSDALAVEMEGRGFLQAAHASQNVQSLVIRGISDVIAQKGKSDKAGFQRLAAVAASAFAFELLANLYSGKRDKIGRYMLVLSATIEDVDRTRAEAIVTHLRQLCKDASLTLIRSTGGSVRLILEGSQSGFRRMLALYRSGRLSQELEIVVLDVSWLEELPVDESAIFSSEGMSEKYRSGDEQGAKQSLAKKGKTIERRLSIQPKWDESMDELLELLVRDYPEPNTVRDVTEKAGLPTRFINFSGDIDHVWMNALREARKFETGLQNIAQVAQKDRSNVDYLTLVRQIDARAFRGPRLDEPNWMGPHTVDEGIEKIIGDQPTFLPISFLQVGLERARSVARVVCPGGLGTGFLTRNDLLITNHHVIASADEARQAKIQFNYQETSRGLAAQVAEFTLAPGDGFATSPISGGDDWTAVRVNGNPNREWGMLDIADADVKVNDYVNIIQHPRGLPMRVAIYHNIVTFVGGDRVQYLTDTLEGSSGSPVFDSQWRIVAVHHSGGWLTEPSSNRKRVFFRNEGIHINVILKGLAENRL
jgi:nucleoside phosphorylase/V8-like Glu-specific endopeptidase